MGAGSSNKKKSKNNYKQDEKVNPNEEIHVVPQAPIEQPVILAKQGVKVHPKEEIHVAPIVQPVILAKHYVKANQKDEIHVAPQAPIEQPVILAKQDVKASQKEEVVPIDPQSEIIPPANNQNNSNQEKQDKAKAERNKIPKAKVVDAVPDNYTQYGAITQEWSEDQPSF